MRGKKPDLYPNVSMMHLQKPARDRLFHPGWLRENFRNPAASLSHWAGCFLQSVQLVVPA